VDIVVGNQNIHMLPEYIEKILNKKLKRALLVDNEDELPPRIDAEFESDRTAFISIMYGCNNFCTYCIVPHVRGRERSVNKEDILRDVKSYVEKGYKEITLLGQNVNSYNGGGKEFAELLKDIAATKNVDIIIACIGENSYCETPGNLSDLAISPSQRELVKALATTGKPIILILNEGRPRLINDLEPLASGIINILLPGNYGADALANILAGDANPSAKMPYTYPRHQAALTTYDYRVSEEMDKMEGAYDYDAVISVQWPFGYGLSYTTFEYSNLRVNHVPVNIPTLQAIQNSAKPSESDNQAKNQYFLNPNSNKRIVIFGHTHDAKIIASDNYNGQKSIYANSGTWIDRNNVTPITMTFIVITPQNSDALLIF
jgi:hypothetical protein